MKSERLTHGGRQQTVEERVVLVRVAERRRLSQRARRQQLHRRLTVDVLLGLIVRLSPTGVPLREASVQTSETAWSSCCMEARAAGASEASVVWRCGTAFCVREKEKSDGERAQHADEKLRLLVSQLGPVEETARETAVTPVEVEETEELRQRGARNPPIARHAYSACCRGPTAGASPSARRGNLRRSNAAQPLSSPMNCVDVM